MTEREVTKLAKLIFAAQWGVTGRSYSTRRKGDWQSKDARRAAEFILTKYTITPRAVDGEYAPEKSK